MNRKAILACFIILLAVASVFLFPFENTGNAISLKKAVQKEAAQRASSPALKAAQQVLLPYNEEEDSKLIREMP